MDTASKVVYPCKVLFNERFQRLIHKPASRKIKKDIPLTDRVFAFFVSCDTSGSGTSEQNSFQKNIHGQWKKHHLIK
jgi:hypothetical protein